MKKLIVLYGEQSAGKTSTLHKVFEILTRQKLPTTSSKPDIRIIFPVGNKWVYMATFGDSESVIQTNFNFFGQNSRGTAAICKFDGKEFSMIDDTKCLKDYTPDICITACRIYKGSTPNKPYDKVNECILKCLPVSEGIHWIAKIKGKGTRKENKVNNTDHETALKIVCEILKENIL